MCISFSRAVEISSFHKDLFLFLCVLRRSGYWNIKLKTRSQVGCGCTFDIILSIPFYLELLSHIKLDLILVKQTLQK